VEPFLAILRAPYLAGPFKLVALDALQTFTSCNLFSEIPVSGGETLAKVVDAVTRFDQFITLSESYDVLQKRMPLSKISLVNANDLKSYTYVTDVDLFKLMPWVTNLCSFKSCTL
jgi:hypothetical protein